MSYTRKFSKRISIPLSIHISDPVVTQNGSSSGRVDVDFNGHHRSFSIGTHGLGGYHDMGHDETVEVDIEVNTVPFDNSIKSCNDHVNLLTGAVAATSVAQVASIESNSKRIAGTIVRGFFKNVQADISSRILELGQRVESRLMHLREQAKTLQAKKAQMESDYQRTRARYSKLFSDLNKELENRVKSLDEPVFKAATLMESESDRMINADFAEIASVIARENTALSSQISAALMRKRAKSAIGSAAEFLRIQKETDRAIRRTTLSDMKGESGSFYLPVCFLEVTDPDGSVVRSCTYDKERLPEAVQGKIDETVFSGEAGTPAMTPEERGSLESFFNARLQEAYQDLTDEHSIRVANTIKQLFFAKS